MGAAGVRSFYQRNTRLFLAFGGGRRAGAIHREVWGPDVNTRLDAFHYVNRCLADRIESQYERSPGTPFRILDLGCGVGGSLCYLLEHVPFVVEGVGVSLSPVQVELAQRRLASLPGGEASCAFVVADYNELPDLGIFDFAYAIESFIHGDRPDRFFQEAARSLKQGGRLYLVDDFLVERRENEWIEVFREGWSTGSLVTHQGVVEMAERNGFAVVEDIDLTPYLRLGRLRDRVIRRVMQIPVVQRLDGSYKRGLSGGDALQMCLAQGWIVYRMIGLEKQKGD